MVISVWAYPEKRHNGGWRNATDLVANPDYYSSGEFPEDAPCPSPELVPRGVKIGDSRIYAALLINERHAWSTNPIRPIVSERGFPSDTSPEVAADFNSMKDEVVHASWVTLQELEEFPWSERTIGRSAMVSKTDAAKFGHNQHGLPRGVSSYSESSADGVRASWTSTYLEAFGKRHLSSILTELREYGAPADVRLVLWCDR